MKSLGILVALLLAVGGFFLLSTPQKWPFPDGTVTVGQTNLSGTTFLYLDGEDMNYLNHFQILSVRSESNELHVERFAVRFAPWASTSVNQQFPLLLPAELVPTGKVEVIVHAKSGLERHQVTVPPNNSSRNPRL